MKLAIARFILGAFYLAAAAAWATPHAHDGNDLWIDPDESGWGLNLFHQGDTLFASLFVYGPDGQPKWYTGSSLVGDDGGPLHDRPAVYSGALYESSGPAFGGAFDPARVTRRQVGSMSVELGADSGGSYAWVNYDVDGTRVINKKIRRFTFVRLGLTGTYTGYQLNAGGVIDDMTMNITLNGTAFAMSTTGSASGSCTYSGTQSQDGSLARIDATYACNNGRSGNFSMAGVDVTKHGFTASSMVAQRTSGSIRGDGYSTDLWFPRNEPGWGLNIIEQGDTLFGTLFVYDAQGRPRWYSASNLQYEQCAPPDAASDCRGRYRGALVESTGPYFGTAFNPAAVQRRQVGTMSIAFYGDNFAVLDYSVDGVSVANKQLERFAFRRNSLSGTYAGHITALGNNDRGVQLGAMTIEVNDSDNAITITMRGAKGTCTMRGTRSQVGRQVIASGAYDCGGATIGQLVLSDVYPTFSGFTGSVGLDGYPIGRIEGARNTAH